MLRLAIFNETNQLGLIEQAQGKAATSRWSTRQERRNETRSFDPEAAPTPRPKSRRSRRRRTPADCCRLTVTGAGSWSTWLG